MFLHSHICTQKAGKVTYKHAKGTQKAPQRHKCNNGYSSTLSVISLPQWGQVRFNASFLCSKSSDIGTLRASAIFSSNCKEVFPFVALLNVTSETSNLSASSFCVIPLSLQSSLIFNSIYF